MMTKYVFVAILATLSIGAFGRLGESSSVALLGRSNAVAAEAATPALTSQSEAFVGKFARTASKIGDSARAALRAKAGEVGTRLASRFGQPTQANLPSRAATKAADEYGISPFAAQAILSSDEVRKAVAEAPIHRGAVDFEDANGKLHRLYRPATTKNASDEIRALVDVDNVVGDYWGVFREKVSRFLSIDKDELPLNPSNYDWSEASTPIRDRFLSGQPLDANLEHFRDWMNERGMYEGFLADDAEFFDVFNPFHRYFVEQGLYRQMEPLPGAKFGLKRLHETWGIGIVTKRFGHDPVRFGWTTPEVPADSAAWISKATDNAFDSITVMGDNKADFAGHVHAVFEDSISNIDKVRATNVQQALRERAFAAGIAVDELDTYLARNNTDVLGVAFRWGYNDDHPLLTAPNVVGVHSWDEAQAVTMAYHKLLTDPNAGANGKLSWRDVPGLSNEDGSPVSSLGGKLRPDAPTPRGGAVKLNGYVPGQGLPHAMGGY